MWQRLQKKYKRLLEDGREKLLSETRYPFREHELLMLPIKPGVYCVYKDDEIIYVGESGNLCDRLYRHHFKRTQTSSLRTNLDAVIGGGEKSINKYLSQCHFSYMVVNIGRKELESYLIDTYQPQFNKLGVTSIRPVMEITRKLSGGAIDCDFKLTCSTGNLISVSAYYDEGITSLVGWRINVPGIKIATRYLGILVQYIQQQCPGRVITSLCKGSPSYIWLDAFLQNGFIISEDEAVRESADAFHEDEVALIKYKSRRRKS